MPKSILIIDDEPDMLEVMQSLLQESGYQVQTSESVDAGLALMKKNLPDLLLLDISMPKITGLDMLSQLKKNPETASVPVIMVSAKRETDTILDAQSMRAADYIMKPFNTEELLSSIKRHI